MAVGGAAWGWRAAAAILVALPVIGIAGLTAAEHSLRTIVTAPLAVVQPKPPEPTPEQRAAEEARRAEEAARAAEAARVAEEARKAEEAKKALEK